MGLGASRSGHVPQGTTPRRRAARAARRLPHGARPTSRATHRPLATEHLDKNSELDSRLIRPRKRLRAPVIGRRRTVRQRHDSHIDHAGHSIGVTVRRARQRRRDVHGSAIVATGARRYCSSTRAAFRSMPRGESICGARRPSTRSGAALRRPSARSRATCWSTRITWSSCWIWCPSHGGRRQLGGSLPHPAQGRQHADG